MLMLTKIQKLSLAFLLLIIVFLWIMFRSIFVLIPTIIIVSGIVWGLLEKKRISRVDTIIFNRFFRLGLSLGFICFSVAFAFFELVIYLYFMGMLCLFLGLVLKVINSKQKFSLVQTFINKKWSAFMIGFGLPLTIGFFLFILLNLLW